MCRAPASDRRSSGTFASEGSTTWPMPSIHTKNDIAGNTGPMTINPVLRKDLPYDSRKDFAPVAWLTSSQMVLMTHPSLPVRTVKEVVALARGNPGAVNYGSAGIGNLTHLGMELFQLFNGIIEDRRAKPRDDLATVLAQGQVDGAPMGPMETFGYYLITFTAGHDTTKNALAGGMRAFAENPDQLALLHRRPELVASAVEEVVRWATPVNYMRRTAARDVELRGQRIRAGDHLVLCYASANRDEEVFEDPERFRIDRQPNRHIAFGVGEHVCLGAHLARLELRCAFGALRERLVSAELSGPVERARSSFVGGIKRAPMRWELRR